MTQTTATDRLITKQAALDSHFEALLTKEIKPYNWRKTVQQVERATKDAERDKAEAERRRRGKLAKIERLMCRNADNDSVLHYLSPLRSQRLVQIFCKLTGCKHSILTSKNKTTMAVKWRHSLMWILRRNTGQSFNQIAAVLGVSNNGTVRYGVRKIEKTPCLLVEALQLEKAVLSFEHETYSQTEGGNS